MSYSKVKMASVCISLMSSGAEVILQEVPDDDEIISICMKDLENDNEIQMFFDIDDLLLAINKIKLKLSGI